jgi:predicted amidohydrolase YtcJ
MVVAALASFLVVLASHKQHATTSRHHRAPAKPPVPAELVVRDAVVHTMAVAGRWDRARASALAVRDGRIVAIGDAPTVAAYVGPQTQVLDLGGAVVVPGLIDSHGHVLSLGRTLSEVSLVGVASYEAVVESVSARAARTPAGEWITGRGWDQNRWPSRSFPTHAALSAAVPGHPVALKRVDGHALLVNRLALERAHITRDTRDPPGGTIVRDAAGEPTGVLVDNACDLVTAVEPPLTAARRQALLRAGLEECARRGLTMVGDAGVDAEEWAAYRALLARDELPIRVNAMAMVPGALGERLLARGPEPGDRLMLRAVKIVADGALGSRGALLSADYSDAPGQRGLETYPFDSLARVAVRARAKGVQVRVHCIGDLASTRTLDAFEQAFGGTPRPALRWAVEHAQVVRPEDVQRFAKLGVVASMQATHATSDGAWAGDRLGPERVGWSYAWRQFLDAGVPLANGSDFPVESPDPLLGLYAAITRRDLEDRLPAGGWRPEERLSPGEALRSFTWTGAWLAFREQDLGSLEVGKQADFVILDHDPILGPASDLLRTRVLRTVVAGRTVYEAKAPGAN